MINCNIIKKIEKTSVINGCDSIDEQLIRLQTIFMYPEGSYIDVFLGMYDSPTTEYYLTDMGQTFSYLADLHISVHESQKNRDIADQICNLLNIQEKNGELFIPIREDFSDAGDAILRLSQACIRIADFYYIEICKPSYHKESPEETFVAGNLDGNQFLEIIDVILKKLDTPKIDIDKRIESLSKKDDISMYSPSGEPPDNILNFKDYLKIDSGGENDNYFPQKSAC